MVGQRGLGLLSRNLRDKGKEKKNKHATAKEIRLKGKKVVPVWYQD